MEQNLRAYLGSLHDLGELSRTVAVIDATAVVEDLEQLCLRELVLDDEIALASSMLFHSETGVLAFVECTRQSTTTKKAREAVFGFVAKFITLLLQARVDAYAQQIQVSKQRQTPVTSNGRIVILIGRLDGSLAASNVQDGIQARCVLKFRFKHSQISVYETLLI